MTASFDRAHHLRSVVSQDPENRHERERIARLLNVVITAPVVRAWFEIVRKESAKAVEAGDAPVFLRSDLVALAARRDAKWTAPFIAGLIRAEKSDAADDEWRRWADMLIDSGEATDAA